MSKSKLSGSAGIKTPQTGITEVVSPSVILNVKEAVHRGAGRRRPGVHFILCFGVARCWQTLKGGLEKRKPRRMADSSNYISSSLFPNVSCREAKRLACQFLLQTERIPGCSERPLNYFFILLNKKKKSPLTDALK